MKKLRNLTTFYFIGFGLLAVIIVIAVISFNHIYSSTEHIFKLAEAVLTKHPNLSASESAGLSAALTEIESIRTRAYIFFASALLLSSVGIFLFVYVYRKNVVEPLHQITSAAKKIALGQFEILPAAIGSTEIGLLAENFNAMSRALRDKIEEIENTLVREQKVVRRLNILNELIGSLIFKLEFNDVLATLINDSKTLIKAGFSAIALIDRHSREISHFHSSMPDKSDELHRMAGSLIKDFLNKGIPLRCSDASKDKCFGDFTSDGLQIKNLLIVPIMIEGEMRGALILGNKVNADEFTAEDEDTALMFTFQAAMAIDRAIFHSKVVLLARTDGLTGLNNHRTFHEILDVEIKRAKRYNRPLSLLLIDLDNFKKFNDAYGHQAGDSVLKKLAEILNKNLRNIDSAARYGGEEFTVILPETSLDDAVAIAERIRDETCQYFSSCKDDINEVSVTVSIGASMFPDDSVDKDGLIKAADDALYMTKKMGKNKVITFQQYKAAGMK
ncbi:MAG: diguanylate cyclase [Nitrospirae bacterium]|nr:diguanylate cyclase [Nitrospirota bacterium]MBI4838652.1 diguanylate cyclase [Nitrospirota bacterium]